MSDHKVRIIPEQAYYISQQEVEALKSENKQLKFQVTHKAGIIAEVLTEIFKRTEQNRILRKACEAVLDHANKHPNMPLLSLNFIHEALNLNPLSNQAMEIQEAMEDVIAYARPMTRPTYDNTVYADNLRCLTKSLSKLDALKTEGNKKPH